MKRIILTCFVTLTLMLALGITYRAGQHTAVDALTGYRPHGNVLFGEAHAQAMTNGPFGLGQLLSNPSIGFGTHPAKPISARQANVDDKPTYNFSVAGTPAANALCSIEGGPSLRTRLRRLCFGPGTAATGAVTLLKVIYTTTAGSGTALTAAQIGKSDQADPSFSGTIRVPGTAGTAGADIYSWNTVSVTTVTTTNAVVQPICLNWDDGLFKSPTLTGATNGVAVTLSAVGTTPVANSATCAGVVTEEAY